MSIKLMYITDNTDVALIAESYGVDRIFVDMEYIGKFERQGGMDTVQSHHTVEDVRRLREAITQAELVVRINPIHNASDNYSSSGDEINAVVDSGADIIMLPYFKTVDEVKKFIDLVNGRARTMLLFETPEAVAAIDDILSIKGIDEVLIGLNDLSLGYGKKFMFELLADGTVERLCLKFRLRGIPYGFGGIAALGKGMLPAERIIAEHYRLGSTCAFLSRSFCNTAEVDDLTRVAAVFKDGLAEIRHFESRCEERMSWFWENREIMSDLVHQILENRV